MIVLFALALLFVSTPRAEAEPYSTDYWVCNSRYSKTSLRLERVASSYNIRVFPGECKYGNNAGGDLRINPDPDYTVYPEPEIDRYRIGNIGHGYRDWVAGEAVFNPPDAWQNMGGIRVHTD